jgi:hypothetical protein
VIYDYNNTLKTQQRTFEAKLDGLDEKQKAFHNWLHLSSYLTFLFEPQIQCKFLFVDFTFIYVNKKNKIYALTAALA